jgi:hypothetical protein
VFAAAPALAQPDLGHKIMGGIGIRAGFQPDTGVYFADKFIWYRSDRVIDRDGRTIPIEGLDVDAFANAIGLSGVWKPAAHGPYVSATIGLPVARAHLSADRPELSLDRFGLADVYVEPLKLGWRLRRADLVSSYAFYVPTGRFTPGGGGGVSRGQWTQEFALGGAVFFDDERGAYLSALASYELNGRKIGIDITRGDTVQIQGGFGRRVSRSVDVGLAGYALWQVRPDRGADLPLALRAVNDRAYGLGPEIDVTIPKARLVATVRYESDIVVRSRTMGQILVLGLSWAAWTPRRR